MVRPQLGAVLKDRCARWNQRYAWLAAALDGTPHLRLPHRPAKEQYVASSLQFSLVDLTKVQIARAIAACAERGLHIKWFGADEPVGFTSVWTHWRYFGEPQSLPNAERVLGGLCDLRLPLVLTEADCAAIGSVVREVLAAIDGAARNRSR
jgi:dTDP-4-amino-4,6-dideoxygalactose transaminase